MNPAGSLFDYAKLRDVSKNVISMMDTDTVYSLVTEWAEQFDPELHGLLTRDPEYSKKIFAIGRGGKKPRKDLAVWSEVRDYAGLFFDELFSIQDSYPENFDKAEIRAILSEYLEVFDISDDQNTWFDRIKAVSEKYGYAPDMKEYKADPSAWKGSVADVSMFLRIAVTGKMNSPDMYTVMQILGAERTLSRIRDIIDRLD